MNDIVASLIDLNHSAGSELVRSLRAIFKAGADLNIRLDEEAAFGPVSKGSPADLAGRVLRRDPDAALLILPDDYGEIERALIRILSREPGRIPVVAVIEDGRPESLIELLRLGVADFLTPPIRAVDVVPRIWRIVEHARRSRTMTERLKETAGLKQLIGKSPAFRAVLDKIPLVARCDSGVLIAGETGTGKELFARAVHYLGPRASKPFIPVNCGAIPAELVENELFGHVRGAYTSAVSTQHGLVRESDGGTLFLDEIDCLPPQAQVKLLRFLQEKEYRQIGSSKTCRADVRVVAATNASLESAVSRGSFRRDLFFRLNIISLGLPPLRERREDIPLLARHFLTRYAAEFSREISDIAPDAMRKLLLHDWPGNVRELESTVERAVIFARGGMIERDDIHLPAREDSGHFESFQEAKNRVIAQFEKSYIQGLLAAHQGNITRAAKTAQKDRRAFWELIRKHAIDVHPFRSDRPCQDNHPAQA